MNRKAITAGLSVIVAVGIGFAAGWSVRGACDDRDFREVSLVHQLERMAFSANALRCRQEGHEDRLNNLLWFGVTSALEHTEAQVAAGVRLPSKLPMSSLVESVDRARGVADRALRTALAARLASLHAKLVPQG